MGAEWRNLHPLPLLSGSESLVGANFCLKIAHLASAREYTLVYYKGHTQISQTFI